MAEYQCLRVHLYILRLHISFMARNIRIVLTYLDERSSSPFARERGKDDLTLEAALAAFFGKIPPVLPTGPLDNTWSRARIIVRA